MKIFILVQNSELGFSLQRYIKYFLGPKSDLYTFLNLEKNIPDLKLYDIAVMDVYKSTDGTFVSMGLQIANLFEARGIPFILFFYNDGLKEEYLISDLQENCFYLPTQIIEFLDSIKKPKKVEKSLNKYLKMFSSSGLTRDH